MYLSRELTDSSLPKIGKEFGGRDHTTVIHATSKIARMIREDRTVYNLVQELTARDQAGQLNLWTRMSPDEPVDNRRSPQFAPTAQCRYGSAERWRLPRASTLSMTTTKDFKKMMETEAVVAQG